MAWIYWTFGSVAVYLIVAMIVLTFASVWARRNQEAPGQATLLAVGWPLFVMLFSAAWLLDRLESLLSLSKGESLHG